MTDTTLRAILIGEDRSMSAALKKVSGKAEDGARHAHAAWSGFGRLIGGEFGQMVSEVDEKLSVVNESQSKFAGKLKTVGTIAASVGALMLDYGSKDKIAQEQLNAAVEATGKGYAGYEADVEKAVQAQVHFGHADTDTKDALRTLTTALQDPKKALGEMALADDLAAAKHESLTAAAEQLAKVHAGNTRILKQFGIEIANTSKMENNLTSAQARHKAAVDQLAHAQKTLADIEEIDRGRKKLTIGQEIQLRNAHQAVADAQQRVHTTAQQVTSAQIALTHATQNQKDAVSQLAERLHGQGEASMVGFQGKVKQVKTWLENTASTVSGKLGGAIATAGPIIFGLGAIIESTTVRTIAMAAWTKIVAGATKAWAAVQWLLNAAMDANPIGIIVVALAALAAGLIYAYHNSESFRKTVDEGFHAIAQTARWLWNNVLAPVIRFIIGGFAAIIEHIAEFLDVLGRIPGFGWAKTAADAMHGAARKALELATNIKDIPPDKVVTVSLRTVGLGALNAALVAVRSLHNQSAIADVRAGHAAGGSNLPAGWSWVGETGKELMYVPGGSSIIDHARSMSMTSGGGELQPVIVQFTLDGRVVHQSLLRLKRANGGTSLQLG